MDIMDKQIGVRSRETKTKKRSNGNLKSEVKNSLEVITTDWTMRKDHKYADKSVEINQSPQ